MELWGASLAVFMFVFPAAKYELSNFSLKNTGQSQTAILNSYRKNIMLHLKKILKVHNILLHLTHNSFRRMKRSVKDNCLLHCFGFCSKISLTLKHLCAAGSAIV